ILIASCVHRNEPVRIVSTTDCHCCKVRSSIGTGGAPKPALLNKKSRRPNAFLVSANRAFTSSGLPTSVLTASILPPPALALDHALSSSPLRRPDAPTSQPSPCNASAADRPMPLPPPVTIATLP